MSTTFTEEQLKTAIDVLAALSATPAAFLERSAPQHQQLKVLRAQMSRCVAAVQEAAVSERKLRGHESPRRTAKSNRPRSKPTVKCYMCRGELAPPSRTNSSLCRICANTSEYYRIATARLEGKHAIVTGGRMGIGFAVVKRLLDCGATVHVTSRFPYDAARRLVDELNSGLPASRLRIYGLDLRDLSAVRRFIATVRSTCEPHILVNNAAQTVRRPPAFYRTSAQREFRSFPGNQASIKYVVDCDLHRAEPRSSKLVDTKVAAPAAELTKAIRPSGLLGRLQKLFTLRVEAPIDPSLVPSSALLSQLPMLPGDVDDEQWLALTEQDEPIDQRRSNSWTQRISDVHPVELVEVQCVNAIAPFLLTQGLFAKARGTPQNPKSVVNLAAAEGSFVVSHRRGTHPHTNMAKAALNMLTRTIAHEFSQRSIYVNSVDPGWVSDQRPHDMVIAAQNSGGLVPPIDYADGAARVMHPIILAANDPTNAYHGKLLRHFRVASW